MGDIFAEHKAKKDLKKGDFVVTELGFPAVIVDNSKNSKTRMIHAFGMAEETGSAYAEDLDKISEEEFENLKTEMFRKFGSQGQWSKEETAKQKKKLMEVV